MWTSNCGGAYDNGMAASRRLKRLVARRKAAGLTQSQIGVRIEALSGWRVNQTTMSTIESGAFPAPAGFLRYYKDALG